MELLSRNVRPPAWAIAFVEVVENAEAKISTVAEKTGLSSDAVLSELRSGLLGLGYVVESGKTKAATIHRPVLFGENEKRKSTTRSMRFTTSWVLRSRSRRGGVRLTTRTIGISCARR
jgi:hypothetical protein